MPTLAERLADAAKVLAPVTETPRLDAEILLAHTLGLSRAHLLARLREPAAGPEFEGLVAQRLRYEPIAYIVGKWEFFSLELEMEPPVLVPRPETEHLVEVVLEFVGERTARVLEIGTGTGCVAIAVAQNAAGCHLVATDISPAALELAMRNAVRHRLSGRIQFRKGDLFRALSREDGPFDVICCNPPYIEDGSWPELPPVIRLHEDPQALLAGKDGLGFIRRLAVETPLFLRPGGLLAFEIGMGQHEKVYTILAEYGYEDKVFRHDLAGIERVAAARRP